MRTISLRLSLVALLALGLALSAPAQAKRGGGEATRLAAKACVQEKNEIGNRAFGKRYGEHAMRSCIRKQRRPARRAIASATAECQSELEDFGPDDFAEDWGSFAECVAEIAEDSLLTDPVDDVPEDDEGEDLF